MPDAFGPQSLFPQQCPSLHIYYILSVNVDPTSEGKQWDQKAASMSLGVQALCAVGIPRQQKGGKAGVRAGFPKS